MTMKRTFFAILCVVLAACGTKAVAQGNDFNPFEYLSYDYGWDFSNNSKEDLRILRNAIFAKHGKKFKDPKLTEYFSQYTWYEPRYDDGSSRLTAVEQKNVANIQKLEKTAPAEKPNGLTPEEVLRRALPKDDCSPESLSLKLRGKLRQADGSPLLAIGSSVQLLTVYILSIEPVNTQDNQFSVKMKLNVKDGEDVITLNLTTLYYMVKENGNWKVDWSDEQ